MKKREQNRNNKLTERERFDCFIERIQTRVAFDWQRTLGWKTFMPENFLEIYPWILDFDAILQHDWPIEQCLSYIRVFWRENEEAMFWSFIHWLIKQITNTYQNHFSRSYENRFMQKLSLPYIFVLMPFCISMNYTNWNFCLKTIHYSFCYSARLRAVPLQSVESKLGKTGESEMAERKTPAFPRLLVFYFRSLRSISSLALPSWGTARSLRGWGFGCLC